MKKAYIIVLLLIITQLLIILGAFSKMNVIEVPIISADLILGIGLFSNLAILGYALYVFVLKADVKNPMK